MNQILVTDKVFITPEFKRKKKAYKLNFIFSIIAVSLLSTYCIYAAYDRDKSEEVSQVLLADMETSERLTNMEPTDTSSTMRKEDNVIIVVLDPNEQIQEEVNVDDLVEKAGIDTTVYTASDGTDNSSIELKDFGTSTQSYTMTSIERTGKVSIYNSYLELLGAQDESNYYQKTSYTLNRITNGLALLNNTTLYTQRGFNMVGGFESLVTNADGSTTKETATIADGSVTRNVDNRIYTLEGVNLIFAKAEGDLSNRNSEDIWGDVNGMAFFGMYRMNRSTGNKEYDIACLCPCSFLNSFGLLICYKF